MFPGSSIHPSNHFVRLFLWEVLIKTNTLMVRSHFYFTEIDWSTQFDLHEYNSLNDGRALRPRS